MGFHLRTTSKRRSPFLPARSAPTSTIRPGAFLKSCVSPSQGINLIHGTRMHDSRAYKRHCAEFAVLPEQDWRQKVDHGCQGLGAWSTFMTPSRAYRHAHVAQGPFFHPKEAMRHNCNISGAWTMFVLDKSEGFTQAVVDRLNDSIRTYVWAILGAQAQRRSNNLKTGAGFDAQKLFLANIEDAIASPVDIPSSIFRYQKTLMHPHPWTSYLGLGSICRRATWHSIRAISRGTTTRSR